MRAASDVGHAEVSGSGDETFATLYEQYRDSLYVFCLARTKDGALAEDIVHDVFVKVLTVGIQPDPTRPLWPLLTLMANRACIDAYRRRTYAASRLEQLAVDRPLVAEGPESTVFHRMECQALQEAIDALPPRQRAALQLYALDAWSYAEVASQLGDSVVKVKSLLQRARAKLRETAERPLAGLVGVRAWLTRQHDALSRLQASTLACRGALAGEGVRALTVGVSTVSILVAALHGVAPSVAEAYEAAAPITAAAVELPPSEQLLPEAVVHVGRREERPVVSPPSDRRAGGPPNAEAVADEVRAAVLPPAEHTPENATLTTVEVSPDYEDDQTVVASGYGTALQRAPLFVTHDGGGSWRRARALGFDGAARFLLPPRDVAPDGTFFALSVKGLQITRDDGETFSTVLPGGYRDGALSPNFGMGDDSMLLVDRGQLYEYRYDTGATRPVLLGDDSATVKVDSVRYEQDGAGRPVAVVAGHRLSASNRQHLLDTRSTFVSRCTRATGQLAPLPRTHVEVEPVHFECSDTPLPDSPETFLSLPKNAGTSTIRFVAQLDNLSVSTDGGRSYTRRLNEPYETPVLSVVKSVEALPSAGERSALVAGFVPYGATRPGLLRTDDAGATWSGLATPLAGFARGVWTVGVAPTGRLFAIGVGYGSGGPLACSADGGRTWGTTCPTPEP